MPNPIYVQNYAPVYLTPSETPVHITQPHASPMPDPSKPLTREQIFQLAQHDTGGYAGNGPNYYVAQNTFGDSGSNDNTLAVTPYGSAYGRYGSTPQPGITRGQEQGDSAPQDAGALGPQQDTFRITSSQGCDSVVSCVRAGNVGGTLSQGYHYFFGGQAASNAEILATAVNDEKSRCLASPETCFVSYTGSRSAYPGEGIGTGPSEATTTVPAETISPEDNAALHRYPQDTVVKVCYGERNCIYGSTDEMSTLNIEATPEAFGAGPNDVLMLKPIAVFSSSEMAQKVASALNSGVSLVLAIQYAVEITLGRPLYVLPKNVAFAP